MGAQLGDFGVTGRAERLDFRAAVRNLFIRGG